MDSETVHWSDEPTTSMIGWLNTRLSMLLLRGCSATRILPTKFIFRSPTSSYVAESGTTRGTRLRTSLPVINQQLVAEWVKFIVYLLTFKLVRCLTFLELRLASRTSANKNLGYTITVYRHPKYNTLFSFNLPNKIQSARSEWSFTKIVFEWDEVLQISEA